MLTRAMFDTIFRAYTAVPSLSGSEDALFEEVYRRFNAAANRPADTQWSIEYKAGHIYYGLFQMQPWKPILDKKRIVYVVHLDRVPNYQNGEPYAQNGAIEGDNYRGQLDNSVSLAILEGLVASGIPMNILFTTWEERGRSWPQLVDMQNKWPDTKLVTMDIDIFQKSDGESLQHITLRTEDEDDTFDQDLVAFLRATAHEQGIPYTIVIGSAIVETGRMSKNTGGAMKGAHIGLPLLNYHSNQELMHWNVIRDAAQLVMAIQGKITQSPRSKTKTTKSTTTATI